MLIKPGIWFPWVPDPFEFSLLGSIPSIRRADGGFLKIADPDQTMTLIFRHFQKADGEDAGNDQADILLKPL